MSLTFQTQHHRHHFCCNNNQCCPSILLATPFPLHSYLALAFPTLTYHYEYAHHVQSKSFCGPLKFVVTLLTVMVTLLKVKFALLKAKVALNEVDRFAPREKNDRIITGLQK